MQSSSSFFKKSSFVLKDNHQFDRQGQASVCAGGGAALTPDFYIKVCSMNV